MPKAAGIPEDTVKTRLRRLLPAHFLFAEEVAGRGAFANVRADFWCYPKGHLVDAGWEPAPFVIEAKAYDLADHRKRTAIHVIQQAIVYSGATFPTQQGDRRPSLVLVHPPLFSLLGIDPLSKFESFEGGIVYGLARVAALFNVGELIVNEDGIEVLFHGGIHYSSKRGFNGSNRLTGRRDVASR